MDKLWYIYTSAYYYSKEKEWLQLLNINIDGCQKHNIVQRKRVMEESSSFSHSVVSDSLWPHWLQHSRLPCPSPSPRVCSNSCPLSQWCHPTFSVSVILFFSCLQSLPASGSFPVSQFFTSSGQSTGASALALVLPMNIQGWFPPGLTGFDPLAGQGVLKSLL